MFFTLFFECSLVEIEEIKRDRLVGIRRDELPLLVVLSEPGFSNIKRSIFAFYCHLDIVTLNRSGNQFRPIRPCLWVRVTQNHNVRCCAFRERMAVEQHGIKFRLRYDGGARNEQTFLDSVFAFRNSLVVRREEYLSSPTLSDEVICCIGNELPAVDFEVFALDGEKVQHLRNNLTPNVWPRQARACRIAYRQRVHVQSIIEHVIQLLEPICSSH